MRSWLALPATLLLAHAVPAAEEPRQKASDVLKPPQRHELSSPITDRFALRVTYFPAKISTQMRLDQTDGTPGTVLIPEDDLGLQDTATQARAEMTFRLREKNRLRVDYFKLGRSGDQLLNRTINFGDQTFNVNERVQTRIEWRQLNFTYSRSLWRSERFEFGVGLGASFLEAHVHGDVVARNVREHHDATGAFPTILIDGTWRISRRWALTARGQKYNANIDDFHGTLADYHGDIQYRWRENFAFGLGYTRLRTLVDVGQGGGAGVNDLTGRFDQVVKGPEVFIRASF